MAELPKLSGPELPPQGGGKPKHLVFLLHGVGADGNDLFGLAPYLQRAAPEAHFISPNAPYRFDMAPFGYQWFSLKDFSMKNREEGVKQAAPILDAFIDEQLDRFGLEEKNLVLIGFSQGTMVSLYVGPRRAKQLAGIIGYSGMLVHEEALKTEIKSKPPILLTHGELDEVLPPACLPHAVAGLEAAGLTVEHQMRPNLPHGIDDVCIQLGQAFLKKVLA
ncbi:MAG: alpha/beta hydrolase [Rhodospirillales bacterium]